MSTYTVAQAKTRLSEPIDRTLKGEGVVITRRMTDADWEWLRAHRAQLTPAKTHA